MKNMKKFVGLSLAALMAVSMTACGSSGDDSENGYLLDDTTTTTAFTVELNTELLLPSRTHR